MTEMIKPIAEWCASFVEALGILIITGIALYALLLAALSFLKKEETGEIFHRVRLRLGRGILLGLEFLVAADIVHTVAVDLTFVTVGVLAVIVLIRTFLSFTLEVELTGSWPWEGKQGQRKEKTN